MPTRTDHHRHHHKGDRSRHEGDMCNTQPDNKHTIIMKSRCSCPALRSNWCRPNSVKWRVFAESRNSNLVMGRVFCAECLSPARRNAARPGIENTNVPPKMFVETQAQSDASCA
jgi:hypothetical protein